MTVLTYRTAGLAAAVASAAALGTAEAFERLGGLVPCALCLLERWPYRIAAVLGLLAWLLPAWLARAVLALMTSTVLAGAVIAAIHVGVELHWWPSPLPECAAPVFRGGSIAERLAHMPAAPSKPCDDPTYLIPGVKLSMAAMNLIFALVLTTATGWTAARRQVTQGHGTERQVTWGK